MVDRVTFQLAEDILNYLWRENYTREKSVILVGNKADLARARVIPTAGKQQVLPTDKLWIVPQFQSIANLPAIDSLLRLRVNWISDLSTYTTHHTAASFRGESSGRLPGLQVYRNLFGDSTQRRRITGRYSQTMSTERDSRQEREAKEWEIRATAWFSNIVESECRPGASSAYLLKRQQIEELRKFACIVVASAAGTRGLAP